MANSYGAQAVAVLNARLSVYASAPSSDGGGEEQYSFGPELQESAQIITAKFPRIGAYSSLSTSDQYWFDTACGVLTAMRIVWQVITDVNQGNTRTKTGDSEYWLGTVPDPAEQAKWKREFEEALRFISSMRAYYVSQSANYSMTHVLGSSRMRERFNAIDISALLPVGWGLLTGSPFAADSAGVELIDNATNNFIP